jgi:hypothetical protein
MTKRRALRGGRRLRTGHTLYWWVEILAIGAFYFVYSQIRNANEGGTVEAFDNARRVIRWERALGMYHEETLQDWALHFKPIVVAANYFYGSLHFVVTIGAAVLLYRWFTDDYPRFRNTLAITTALALIGFITFPLMPPRLLPGTYSFEDTLAQYPTFWSFNSGAVSKISNQYAAMPSVHVAWATWCAIVLAPRLRRSWGRTLAVLYPLFTVVVIVLTGNHYVLDAVGGLIVLAVGWVIAHRVTRAGRARPARAPATAVAA